MSDKPYDKDMNAERVIARVNEDGRITIPAAARRRLGLKPKSRVRVEVLDDRIVVRPVESIADQPKMDR